MRFTVRRAYKCGNTRSRYQVCAIQHSSMKTAVAMNAWAKAQPPYEPGRLIKSPVPPASTHRHCFAQYEPTSLPTYLSLLFVVIPVPFVLNFRRFWWRVFYVELTLGFSAHAMTHARRSGVIDSGFIGSGTKRIANEINSPIPNQSGNLGFLLVGIKGEIAVNRDCQRSDSIRN